MTPGTSTGYCMARNRPARARSSTFIARTSSPSSVTVPPVTVYFGWPAMRVGQGRLAGAVGAHDRVRLAGPDGEVDAAQDLLGAVLGLDGDVQVADLEGGHGFALQFFGLRRRRRTRRRRRSSRGRQRRGSMAGGPVRLAGAQVEPGAVQPALDRAVLDLALGQRDVGVGAGVVDGVDVAGARRGRSRRPVAVDVRGDGAHLGQVVDRQTRTNVSDGRSRTGAASAPAARSIDSASSASMAAMRRSCTSGTPIRWTMSAKKPRTTRRRASCSGMPRACR